MEEIDLREEVLIEFMILFELENFGQWGLIQVVGFSFVKGNEGKFFSLGNLY